MGVQDRRLRERSARRRLIVATARAVAEREGWPAVTSRRLATEIEYSQPVLYKHFGSLDDIVDAVALEGFGELAEAIASATTDCEPRAALERAADAYCAFAGSNPALYDAMFNRPTRLRFAVEETPGEMTAAFVALRDAVAPVAGDEDVDTLTEVLWAALHGLTMLGRSERLRPVHDRERLGILVRQLLRGAPAPSRRSRSASRSQR